MDRNMAAALDRYITGNYGEDSMTEYPPQCDDCKDYDGEANKCPFGSWDAGDVNFDMCPRVAVVKECAECKKPIGEVRGKLRERGLVVYFWGEMFVCSQGCEDRLRAKVDEEIEVLKADAKREY